MARIRAAQRRNDFIAAAVEVIAAHGIDGATTRRIADQAQANLAMLHYCYDSKEALFSDVYVYVGGKYRDVIKQSDTGTTIHESARAVLRGVMQYYLDSPSFTATSFELVNWARRQHGERGMAVFEEAFVTLRTVLSEAASDHPIDADTIEEIAYVVSTLADGFAANWLTFGDRDAALQQIEILTSVLSFWLTGRLAHAAAAS